MGKSFLSWVVIFLIMITFSNFIVGSDGLNGNKVVFSDFMKKVNDGEVVQVDIKGNDLEGILKDGNRFYTHLPQYPNLVDKLQEKNVAINSLPLVSKSEKIVAGFLGWLPFLIMIGLWLYFAKGDIIKYDNCYLCEGYTDVISMFQAGIQNVVSSSGTSLTKEQIKLISRYTQNITILYDGDTAGIKASFRGIDLILEEGLNVKVVLFPDGEDPDSYAKKVSSVELETYITQNKQDFISFKSSVLLNNDDTQDPIKRASLIRDIVYSVALIPDQITRTVYLQQIAKQFNISEQVVSNELIKQRKLVLSKQLQEPEIAAIPIEKQVDLLSSPEKQKEEPNHHAEFDLIRLMIKYGTRLVNTTQLDEMGKTTVVETSVIELIHHELEKDELNFTHPLYAKIYRIYIDALNERQLLESSYLKRIEDQDVVRFVSDIETNEYELSSKWYSAYRIYTRSESDRLNEAVVHSIYGFKGAKIEAEIQTLREQLEKSDKLTDEEINDLLSQQILYEKVKMTLAEKLGRIILR